MTDASGSPGSPPALRPELAPWCEAWKSCLQNVITQVSGNVATTFEISVQPLVTAESDVWYTVVAGGAVSGEMALRLPAASGTRLARKFLGETEPAPAGDDDSITADNKEALEELLRQIAGLAATAVGAAAGGEVKLNLSASVAPSWSSEAVVGPKMRTAAPKPAPAMSAEDEPPTSSYRRLVNVGLDVKLRFGTRRMLLRDVLALSAGVVVELDNSLHSPVDLLLDGRLIAQGEVVVVDGKYGLRVTEVVDARPPGS